MDVPATFSFDRPERGQVVVVERDPVGTQLSQPVHGLHWIEWRSGRFAEWIPTRPPDRPQAEAKPISPSWSGHRDLLSFNALTNVAWASRGVVQFLDGTRAPCRQASQLLRGPRLAASFVR